MAWTAVDEQKMKKSWGSGKGSGSSARCLATRLLLLFIPKGSKSFVKASLLNLIYTLRNKDKENKVYFRQTV